MPQSSPDFPISLPGEHRFGENLANLHQQFLVAAHLGTTFLRLFSLLLPLPSGIEAGPRQVPGRHHRHHTIRSVTGRRNGAAHGFDFQNAKGRPFSMRAIFSRSNSFSMLTVATTDFKRRRSSSSTSLSRVFRPTSPPARKRSRHWLRVAAVTRYFRDVDSRSAPRSSSRLTDTLGSADHRPPPAVADDSEPSSVGLRPPSGAPESCFFGLDMHSLLQNIFYFKCSQCTVQLNRGPGDWMCSGRARNVAELTCQDTQSLSLSAPVTVTVPHD